MELIISNIVCPLKISRSGTSLSLIVVALKFLKDRNQLEVMMKVILS